MTSTEVTLCFEAWRSSHVLIGFSDKLSFPLGCFCNVFLGWEIPNIPLNATLEPTSLNLAEDELNSDM